MRMNHIAHILGIVTIFMALAMIPAGVLAWFDQEASCYLWGGYTVILLVLGLVVNRVFQMQKELSYREGFAVVSFSWLILGLWGAVPYLFTGVFDQFIPAFFESASGFTTTGATAITDIEILPRSILLWRSLTHWFGGMGVIVLSVSILPLLGVGGMQLFRAETPGPVTDKLTPRIASTAKILWRIYLLFTVVQMGLLYWCGMSWFDSICHTFSTLATGGFSTRNASLIAYQSPAIEGVTTVFMILAGINFSLHYRMLRGDWRAYGKNSELKFYLTILLISFLAITWNTYGSIYDNLWETIRFVGFQIVSLSTTTGFVTADFNLWPSFSQVILVGLMIMGACAGSTGGGTKVIRVLLVMKYGVRELRRLLHPRAVFQLKLRGQTVPKETVQGVLGLFVFSVFLLMGATVVMAFFGLDIVTATTSVIACLWNIGPGLAKVGAVENYAHIPNLGKLFLSGCMIMGRLEVFTVIILLSPEFWRR